MLTVPLYRGGSGGVFEGVRLTGTFLLLFRVKLVCASGRQSLSGAPLFVPRACWYLS